MNDQSLQAWNAINEAHSFDLLDSDPTHLSPQQLDQVIQLTLAALNKHVVFGYSFGRFAGEYPEHPHTITWKHDRKLSAPCHRNLIRRAWRRPIRKPSIA